MITLDIISDPICPWCYIGKNALDKAIEEVGENPFEINWRCFQLNPDMPEAGMDRREYLENKFGGQEGAVRVYSQIEARAKADGLEIDFGAIKRTPNTIDAHRLILWAKASGDQSAVKEELFRRYFKEGQDIGDHQVLLDVAKTVGMEVDVIAQLLASDTDKQALRDEDAGFRKMGVSGVPTFVIAGQHVLSGAQPVENWTRIIKDIVEALEKQAAD